MTKWDEAWEAWDDVETPKTESTAEEPSVEVKPKGKGGGLVWLATIALVVLAIVYMSGEDSKPPNAGSTFSPVKGTDPVTFPPPPVNRPGPGPVTLPEGTWRPPSYSEQKRRQAPSRTTSRTSQDMTAEEAAVLALDGVSLPAKAKLIDEVVRTILRMNEICKDADIRSSAAVLSLTYEAHAEYLDWEMAIAASTPPRATAENIMFAVLYAIHDEVLSNLAANNCGTIAKQSDSQTILDITHPEIPRLAPDALSRSGYPDRPDLVVEVARAMQEIRNACPGTYIEVIAGLLAGEYGRKPWAQIQTKAHASVVEMNRVVSERIQAGPLCSREVDVTGLAMMVLSDANYPHNPNRERDQVLIESVESGIQRIQEACPGYPEDFIATALSELYQEGGLPTWRHYQSESDSDLMAANLAGLSLHLTLTSVIDELRNGGCE